MKSKLRRLLALSVISMSFSAPSAYGATVTFNTAGTTTWVCPPGVTSIQVECWGGGGAGGAGRKDGQTSTNTMQNGGGGGGGAYARRAAVPVTPGTSYTITIPAAAVSGSNGTTTSGGGRVNGGSVTFVGDSGVTITAAGGQGGANAYVNGSNTTVTAGGGAGGTVAASIGDVGAVFAGGAGASGTTGATGASGSGGGGAGSTAAGGPGTAVVSGSSTATPSPSTGGTGGSVGGGNGGSGFGAGPTAGNASAGGPGQTAGGGGGGGHNTGQNTRLGGTGGLGQISITYPDEIVKADNIDDLNLTTSWVGGIVPNEAFRAVWNDTVTSENTTSLAADATWAGIIVADPAGLVTINAGNVLTLGNADVDIDMSAATQDLALNCALAMNNPNTWSVSAGRTLSLNGVVSGSAAVTKTGAGTVVMSGANTYTGSTNVSGGTLNVTGSITGLPASSKINIAPTSGNAIVNYSGGNSTLFAVTGATVAGTASAFNMTAGNVTISPGIATSTQSVVGAGNTPAAGAGAYGYYNITGGTFKDTNRFTLTAQATASATNGTGAGVQTGVVFVGGTGVIDQTGGEWMLNYSLGQITVADSGKIDRTGTTAPFGIFMNHAANVTGGGYGVLNLAGTNAEVITGAQPIRFGNSTTANAGSGQSGFVNVAAGTLSVGVNANTSLPASPVAINNAYFNFAGGTVKATGNLSGWIPTSNASINFNSTIFGPVDNPGTSSDFSGGVTFDTNGFSMAVANPLQAASGAGVTQADLSVTGGSGYVGAPAVIFSSTDVIAGGTPAAGYAVISGGAVSEIVITSPGTYTPGTIPTVTLIGGGGTGASVSVAELNTANTGGGLTKIGAGILTLSGANTYTGATTVSAGTLKSSTAGSAATDVSVSTGAAAGALVAADDGQWVNAGDLTFANGSTLTVDYGSTVPSTTLAPIVVDNLVLGTNLALQVEGSLINTLAVGQSYPLATWTTSGPADGSAFTSITPPRLVGNFSVTGNTLFLNVTSNTAGQPISWNTGDGSWTATSWIDANLNSTAYIDPFDSVLFGDAAGATGDPTVTLTSSISPMSVTMNSLSHDYSITGSGGIAGAGALTLDASNTRTLTLATVNSYTGGTVINGGTLRLSGSGTLGAANSTVAVSSGALLDLNGTSRSITFAAGAGVGTVANNSGSGTSVLTLTGTTNPINASHIAIVDNTNSSAGNVAVVITGNTQPVSNANTYSGGTTVNAGAFLYLLGSTPSGAGTGPISLPASGATTSVSSGLLVDGATYANDISGAGYIHNNVNGAATAVFTGNVNTSGTFNFRNAAAAFEFAGSGTSVLSGVIGPVGGNGVFGPNATVSGGSIIKSGTGDVTLSGANLYSGTTTVRSGTLTLSGPRTATAGVFTVGNQLSTTAILNISNGTFTTGQFNVGSGDDALTHGIVNQTGGTLTMSGNQLLLGNLGTGTAVGSNSTGTYNLSGGTLNTVAGGVGVLIGVNTGTTGVFNLSGTGTLSMAPTSTMQIARSDGNTATNTTGTFSQTGGTATVGILRMAGSGAATGAGGNATLSLTGGTFSAVTFNALSMGNNSTSTIIIGGTADVTLPAFPTARGSDATATVTFDGGILKPLAASATYMGGLTNAFIKAGGAKFDTTNGSITIAQSLLTDTMSTGGGLTKEGTNSLTLAGANTYTGNTVVNDGTLALADGAQLKFVLGASSGLNNSISGAGIAVLDGDFVIDTTAADSLESGTWTLENVTTLTGEYGSTFTVVGFVDAGSNKWTKDIGGGKAYTFDETTGVLTLGAAGYSSWATLNGAGENLNDDHDNDGVPNGVEYFLGGPNGNTTGFTALPGVTNSEGTLSITWVMGSGYTGVYNTDFTVETSDTLTGTWTTESTPGTVTISGSNVTYTFPTPLGTKKFARLKVTGP